MFNSLPDGEFFQILKWAFLLFPWKTFLCALVIPSLLLYLLLTWADSYIVMFGHPTCFFLGSDTVMVATTHAGLVLLFCGLIPLFSHGFCLRVPYPNAIWWQCLFSGKSVLTGENPFFPFWKEKTLNFLFKVVLHLQIVSLLNSKFQTWSGCSMEGLSPPQVAFHP